jgi:curved DNA-binding protein CbpA
MDFENKDHYQILGVPRNASKEEIREAYLEIARIYHPDSNFYSDIVDGATNNDEQHIFKIVTAAYSVLNDDRKRAEYTSKLPPDEGSAGMTEEQSAQMFSDAKDWHQSRMDTEEGKRSEKYRERKKTASFQRPKMDPEPPARPRADSTKFQRPRADSMTMSSFGREALMRQQVAAEAQVKMKRQFALLAIFVLGIAIGTVILVIFR